MLLIGDHQAQIPEHCVPGDKGVGADDKVDLPLFQRRLPLPLLLGGTGPCKEPQAHPQPLQERGQAFAVLFRQDLGGSHQGALAAVLPGKPAAGGGYHRLAAPYIPLDQAVHGGVGTEVLHRLPNGPFLGPGEGKGQRLPEGGHIHRLHRPDPLPLAALFHPGKADAQAQQLLKDQPPAGPLHRLPGGGMVNQLQGLPQRTEAVFLPHPLRQRFGDGGQEGQSGGDILPNPPAAEAGGEGIDGGKAAGIPRVDSGVGHLPAGQRALHQPIEEVFLPLLQAGHCIFSVKKGQSKGVLSIHPQEPLGGEALPEHPLRLLPPQNGPYRLLFLQDAFPDGDGLAQVHIVPGDMAQELLHGGDPQLLVELHPPLPHPPQEADFAFQCDGDGRLPLSPLG